MLSRPNDETPARVSGNPDTNSAIQASYRNKQAPLPEEYLQECRCQAAPMVNKRSADTSLDFGEHRREPPLYRSVYDNDTERNTHNIAILALQCLQYSSQSHRMGNSRLSPRSWFFTLYFLVDWFHFLSVLGKMSLAILIV